ncbi:MAG: class sortase [Glaciihabitans sp.]|nr:class sortase [Glaciihabitans sp.]
MTVEAGDTEAESFRPRKSDRKRHGKREPRPARRFSILGLLGELMLTAGVLVMLFLGWQLWLNDIIVGSRQEQAASELGQSWAAAVPTDTPTEAATDAPTGPGEPVVLADDLVNAEDFAVLIVPRWGEGWERTITEGIGVQDVLNKGRLGHYPSTQLPGEVGNFAIASHRMAYGGGFKDLHQLQLGDHIYVETQDGWYSYVYRSSEYVLPTGVGVIAEVPQQPGVAAVDRMITLTTCNPFFSTAERLIAYGVYDTWYPRAGGPPAEIAGTVNARNS